LDIKIVKGKNSDVSDELKLYVAEKLTKLTRYGGRLQAATATFTERASKKRDKAFKVEVVLHAPGQSMRCVDEGSSFQAALDMAVDALREQLKKQKAKRIDKNRETSDIAQVITAEAEPKPAKKSRRKIEVRKFTLKPMSLDEAIMQLDLYDRDFYLFYNEQKHINCVFKRSDGGYGLMVPETDIIQ
jgi:putative sigma-54 modulation protein